MAAFVESQAVIELRVKAGTDRSSLGHKNHSPTMSVTAAAKKRGKCQRMGVLTLDEMEKKERFVVLERLADATPLQRKPVISALQAAAERQDSKQGMKFKREAKPHERGPINGAAFQAEWECSRSYVEARQKLIGSSLTL
ncbi:hypothetical protein FQA47_013120 [Oryzias melastigma]|uniref:Uncharacterized protein n=1 Tax=Oryzias melastigma TaxID=30732 RepID=A0A834F364_ORYME|nr:hypothetical protein FQA47_013120 [Oryzias melastigma]